MGEQRRTNYALRAEDKATFVDLVTEGQPPAPGYFVYNAILGHQGRELLDETEMPPAMSYDEVKAAMAGGAVLVDGHAPEEFASGYLNGAINIGLEGRYAEFAGSVIKPDVDLILLAEPGRELEGKNRLARIGFDRVVGYLAEPYQVMLANPDDVHVASRLTAPAMDERMRDVSDLQVVDVRNPGRGGGGDDPRRGRHPGRTAARPARRTRPGQADRRLLRRRIPVVGGSQPAAAARFRRRRQRHPGQVQRWEVAGANA